MKQVKLFPILFVLLLLNVSWVSAGEVSVTAPWIREAPPGAAMLAAYMTINNRSSNTATLVSVSSPDFPMIQIHKTKIQNGMAHMQKQANLQIEPGHSVVLEPGGYHLMLMHPARSLKAGEEVKLQLHLDDGQVIDIAAPVRKIAQPAENPGKHTR